MSSSKSSSRRTFLQTAGVLTIGFPWYWDCWAPREENSTAPLDALPASLAEQPRISAWLEVLADGRVRIFTGKMELGQGIRTAIAQVAAEELNTAIDLVEVHLAETEVTPDEGYTAGSRSVVHSAMSVRQAAAAAGRILLDRAAEQYDRPRAEIALQDGQVVSSSGDWSVTFADLLDGAQIDREITTPVPLKPKADYRWVGQPVPRQDIEHMVRGEAHYVQDLRLPGMLHARVVRPRNHNSRLKELNQDVLTGEVEGLRQVVVDGSFVGIITEDEYQAVKAQTLLEEVAEWETEPLPEVDSLPQYLKQIAQRDRSVRSDDNFDPDAEMITAAYAKPYHLHGSIGPSCAVARYTEDGLEIWSHSQGVYPLRESLVALTGLDRAAIHIKGVPGSGCYGHNGADDVAADAALLALAYPGRPIRLQWSRQNEHLWEPYGSAMLMECRASLDTSGRIDQWGYELWSDTHSTRPGGNAARLLPARYVADASELESRGYLGGAVRNSEPYYAIPTQRIDANFFQGPLRVSALRSLGAYANIFAIESFMDELAEHAGSDPIDFRLRHAQDDRSRAILERLRAETASVTPGDNEGLGYGFSRYKNSAAYCGVAAQVRVDPADGSIRVLRLWGVIDAGECINPDGLRNQTEGGMIQSACWTLREGVSFGPEGVTSEDWNQYPIFRFRDAPAEVSAVVIDRPNEPALGAGEAAQGPTAAAVANAVYRASGVRVRELPIEGKVGS